MNSPLQTLDISQNNIPKRYAFDVAMAICHAKLLQSLSLNGLQCVSDDVLIHILRKSSSCLRRLELDGVGIARPMKLELVDMLVEMFQNDLEYVSLFGLHEDDFATLKTQWEYCKGNLAVVKGPLGRRRKCQFSLSTKK